MNYYGTAKVCLNGHMVTPSIEFNTTRKVDFCSKCGSKTITKCPKCEATINGNLYDDQLPIEWYSIKTNVDPITPLYCHSCGSPYPWTETALKSAESIIRLDEQLTEEQIQAFCECLPDLIVETQKSQLALIQFKRFIDKAASVTGPAVLEILINISSSGMAQKLFGLA